MPSTNIINKRLSINDIQMKAKNVGVNPGKMNKIDLIHAIQTAEGNKPCFGCSNGSCIYSDCCFMADCLKIRL